MNLGFELVSREAGLGWDLGLGFPLAGLGWAGLGQDFRDWNLILNLGSFATGTGIESGRVWGLGFRVWGLGSL